MLLNAALHGLHLTVVGLNMFGWMVPRVRVLSALVQIGTLACWVGFGVVNGWWGYCPLTDWHWHALQQQGVTHLPPNYISYILEQWAGVTLPYATVTGLIAGCLGMAVLINGYLLLQRRSR